MSKEHWDIVYATKGDVEVSWTQLESRLSLSLIIEACPPPGCVIDVGGGTSSLAGRLLDAGYEVAILDISEVALARARDRLGDRAARIRWVAADITSNLSLGEFDVWHDRAVFHFLTSPIDRQRYVEALGRTVPVGGHAVLATFAPDGPEKCSGLDVVRYDGPSLARELGDRFALLKTLPETHVTPWGKSQSFQYSVFRLSR